MIHTFPSRPTDQLKQISPRSKWEEVAFYPVRLQIRRTIKIKRLGGILAIWPVASWALSHSIIFTPHCAANNKDDVLSLGITRRASTPQVHVTCCQPVITVCMNGRPRPDYLHCCSQPILKVVETSDWTPHNFTLLQELEVASAWSEDNIYRKFWERCAAALFKAG